MDEADDDIRPPGPTVGPEPAAPLSVPDHRVGTPLDPDGVKTERGPSPFRRHPARWTVAAGGLAMMLALGGYGVTQAATSSTPAAAAAATGTGSSRSQGPPGITGAGPSGTSAPTGTAPGGFKGGPPGGLGAAAKGGKIGKVTAISGDTITLTTRAGTTITVTVTSSTVFKEGTTTSTLGALQHGDIAVVAGSTSSDGTVTAATVTFGTAPSGAPGTNTLPSGA